MRTLSLPLLSLLVGCASTPPDTSPEAAPPADLAVLVTDAPRQFAAVRGVADTTRDYGYGDEISTETLYRAPLAADSAREAVVTVTTAPDGAITASYRAFFGLSTSDLGFDQREERQRREAYNEAVRDALADLAQQALPGWTPGQDSFRPSVHECQGFFGRRVEISTSMDGVRLDVLSGERPCLSDADRALLLAATSGDTDALAQALDEGASLSASGTAQYGSTALHLAAGGGHEAAVRLLLERGADPDAVSDEGLTPLLHATPEVARLLIDAGADVNPEDTYGSGTPLGNAVISDDLDYIRLLLDAGADPDAIVPVLSQQGPLHFAVTNGSADAIRLLLDAGADPNLADELGFTPLLYAVSGQEIGNPEVAIEIARLLLAAGADVNHASRADNSYAWTPLTQAARNGEAELVRFLLGVDGIDLAARNTEGLTALGAARSEGFDEVAEILAEAGVPE